MRTLLALTFIVTSAPVAAQDITGAARIIDGDTLEVAGQRIRIHDIDAPETRQLCSTGMDRTACGKRATRDTATCC
jgi:endonuclease YncB( thermonuclease family)